MQLNAKRRGPPFHQRKVGPSPPNRPPASGVLNKERQLLCSLLAESNIQTYSPNDWRRFNRALSFQRRDHCFQIAPGLPKPFESGHEAPGSAPRAPICQQTPLWRPLHAKRDDSRSGLQMSDNVLERAGRAHDVMRERKERSISLSRELSIFDR